MEPPLTLWCFTMCSALLLWYIICVKQTTFENDKSQNVFCMTRDLRESCSMHVCLSLSLSLSLSLPLFLSLWTSRDISVTRRLHKRKCQEVDHFKIANKTLRTCGQEHLALGVNTWKAAIEIYVEHHDGQCVDFIIWWSKILCKPKH